MHAAQPKRGDRGPQPPARFGDFSAVKSPPPEATKLALQSAFVEQTRLRRARADVGIGPYESERYKWPSATTVPFARGRCAARAAI